MQSWRASRLRPIPALNSRSLCCIVFRAVPLRDAGSDQPEWPMARTVRRRATGDCDRTHGEVKRDRSSMSMAWKSTCKCPLEFQLNVSTPNCYHRPQLPVKVRSQGMTPMTKHGRNG
ncbi:hypothetical protein HBI56_010410 [Parastagonospora nodorum]|nr:hypothetical protein HBI10_094930 [Parastagonospora nodorum]KAH4033463.1 hypothetical protein HBI13_010820 [Parastagonospora nodorum]KAH4235098.1 hypothetical protein HBI06_058960 [Parastagonospora nodorum]KAH4249893.1 hypothetical protein HBI05_011170 [Parastagonospora nodorum]KAH4352864.1 hypothetical protein HBH98_026560 [Parastagonospora nodorum]